MTKIVNPAICSIVTSAGTEKRVRAYAEIEYKDRRLSITGVVGPTHDGNSMGSAGQCVDEIRGGDPAENWDAGMLERFCDIWERWHLNDMRPGCVHQQSLWKDLFDRKVTFYKYQLNREAGDRKSGAEKKALEALRAGKTFTPDADDVLHANLKNFITSYMNPLPDGLAPFYEPFIRNRRQESETKTLGWIYPSEHPDGLLTRPCSVCGYRYGTKHLSEKVPEDVLEWLFSLPDTAKQPAWV